MYLSVVYIISKIYAYLQSSKILQFRGKVMYSSAIIIFKGELTFTRWL